jgi:hypothetical protein
MESIHRTGALGVLLCLAASGASQQASEPVALTAEQIVCRVGRAEDRRRELLLEYTASRRYLLHNPRMKHDAEMLVRMDYRKGQGKVFQVLAADGAEGISRRVFDKLLAGEAEGSFKNNVDRNLNSQNYEVRLVGQEGCEGRRCYVLALAAKTKSKYLLNGKAWIDAEDFAVVRMEGRPAASLSFWVGKPYIVQEFEKVGDFWMASRNVSRSETRLLGTSDLTIESSGYLVNGAGAESVAVNRRVGAALN